MENLSDISYIFTYLAAGIDVFAMHPGFIWTSIHSPMRGAIGFYPYILSYPLLRIFRFIMAKTPKTGAQTTIYCAVEPTLHESPAIYFEYVVF